MSFILFSAPLSGGPCLFRLSGFNWPPCTPLAPFGVGCRNEELRPRLITRDTRGYLVREKYFPHQNTRAVPTHNSWPRIESQAKISLYGSRSSELAQPPTMLCHSGLFLFPPSQSNLWLALFFFFCQSCKNMLFSTVMNGFVSFGFFFFRFYKATGTHT